MTDRFVTVVTNHHHIEDELMYLMIDLVELRVAAEMGSGDILHDREYMNTLATHCNKLWLSCGDSDEVYQFIQHDEVRDAEH